MSGGGVKSSSHGTYLDQFLEFWRTMDRLGLEEELVFKFPSDDVVLQIYIVDCAVMRQTPNVYDTVRNKLRSIDYVSQLAGQKQSWSDNPALYASMQFVKRRNPGKGSDTLPVTAPTLVRIVHHVMATRVYYGLQLTPTECQLKKHWLSFPTIWRSTTRRWWYTFAVSVLTMTVLGLRGAECYKNKNPLYEGYGLVLDDVTVYWKWANTVYANNALSKATDSIHHIRVRLRNTKTGFVGKSTYLRIGRTRRTIEPAIILYHLYQLRLKERDTICGGQRDDGFLFSARNQDLSLQNVKKKWQGVVQETISIEPERYRFHGTRKGFATTLLRNGVRMSLIAFAGRWKLKAAIGRYLIHTQDELLDIVRLFLYGKVLNADSLDLDEDERDIIRSLHHEKRTLNTECFKNTEALYDAQWIG